MAFWRNDSAAVTSLVSRLRLRQLIASVSLLFLLVTSFASVMVRPAYANKLDECLHSLGDAAVLASTLEQDLPGIGKCAAQIGGGDLVMAGVAVILAGYAAANGGFHTGGGDQVDQCNATVNQAILGEIVAGLKALHDAGSAGRGVVDALFGGEDNAQKVFNSPGVGAALAGELQNIPGFSEVMSEISCGCSIVGGAIDIGEATVKLGKDAGACGEVVAGFFIGVGKAIGSGFYEAGEFIECGGFTGGACPTPGVQETQTNTVYKNCQPGFVTLQTHTEHDVDQAHGDVVKTWKSPDCICPQGTHASYPGGDTAQTASKMSCECNDRTQGYQSDGSCSACPSGPGIGQDLSGACGYFNCPQVPGMIATPVVPGAESQGWGNCSYHHACGDGSVPSDTPGSCVACSAGQVAEYGNDAIGYFSSGGSYYSGTSLSAGYCGACPYRTSSPAGSTSCEPLKCSLTQRVGSDGHSCVACDQIGTVSGTQVCENTNGTPLYQPQECDPGTASIIDGKSYASAYDASDCRPFTCSPAKKHSPDGHSCLACSSTVTLTADGSSILQVSRPTPGRETKVRVPHGIVACADPDRDRPNCAWGTKDSWLTCQPLNCKGTDHPDDGGHACETCKLVLNISADSFGGLGHDYTAVPPADGRMNARFASGKTLSFEPIEEKSGIKSVKVVSADGKTQVMNVGDKPKGKLIAVCLDPDNNPAHQPKQQPDFTNYGKIPGIVVYRQPPDLNVKDFTPIPKTGSSNLGSNPDPIKPDLGQDLQKQIGVAIPSALPGRPPIPPPPSGGIGQNLPAKGTKDGTSRTVPAQREPSTTGPDRQRANGKNDSGASGHTLPAHGDDTGGKSSQKTTKLDPDAPPKKPKGKTTSRTRRDGQYKLGSTPASNGNGDIGVRVPAHRGDASGVSRPQPRATPQLNRGPQLRATPQLKRPTPSLQTPTRMVPTLTPGSTITLPGSVRTPTSPPYPTIR